MKKYLVVCCLFVWVACGSQAFGAEEEKFVVKLYDAGDLMFPAVNGSLDKKAAQVMNLITQNVKPKSWSASGGQGTVEFFPLGLSLVVKQTPEAHKEIEKYLKQLRKNLEEEEKAKEKK